MARPPRSDARPVSPSVQDRRRRSLAVAADPAEATLRRRPAPEARGRRRGPQRRPWRRRALLVLAAGCGLLWLSRARLLPPAPPPQLILVLGGDVDRERLAARLASADGLPVLVSSGSNPEYARWLF